MSAALAKLLAALPTADRVNFETLDASLLALRYTGPVTLHYFNGVKKQVDLGAPVRLSIVEGVDTAPRSTGS